MEARGKSISLNLVDYQINRVDDEYYVIELWVYNSGWSRAHVTEFIVPGYESSIDVVLEPGVVEKIVLYVPTSKCVEPEKVVLVTDCGRSFLFELH